MRCMYYRNVYPRYTPGSPALVSGHIACQVAREEREFIKHALSGVWGEQRQERAKRWGLRGISEEVRETRGGWEVFDLITGEEYFRPSSDKMRKDGWAHWDELPPHFQQLFPHMEPPLNRHYWFKPELVRDREGFVDWKLRQWEPDIRFVDKERIAYIHGASA
jgi:hypothetical protein